MRSLVGRARFASMLAVACALIITGVAAGAAGSALIIGQVNDSGTSQTVLSNAGLGAAFTLKTTNTANNATGIFGWSSSTSTGATRGVYGKADGPNSFGVFGRQGGAAGTGAAIYAEGNNNVGIVAVSSETTAIHATASCSSFLCGAAGIVGDGGGFFGSGVVGNGTGLGAGVYGTGGFEGVFGTNTGTGGSGVYGSGVNGPGVTGTSGGAGTIDYDCGTLPCWDYAGGSFAAYIGVIGQTDGVGPQGYSRGVLGIAGAGGTWAMYASGDMNVTGNLYVGTCTGCAIATMAQNGSKQTIAQGDAVTLLGAATGPDGSVVMVVGPAKAGDAVFGIADEAMAMTPAKVTTKASSIKVSGITTKTKTVKSPSFTVQSKDRKWAAGGTSAKANAYLRVITSGMLVYKAGAGGVAAAAGLTAGDALAVGTTAGKLAKADKNAAKGSVAGKFGGKLKDGRVVIFVDPS